jgi:WD40 repeat protein
VPGSPGSILVAGGARFIGYLSRSQIFNPAGGSAPITNDAELNQARAYHTGTLLKDGTVLVVGGDNGVTAFQSAELYEPSSTGIGAFKATGTMFAPRTHHAATLLSDGKVLITGGSPGVQMVQVDGEPHPEPAPSGANNSAELYDPASGAFVGITQSMTVARTEHTATLLKTGKVLITGGVDNTGAVLATAEIYDPRTQTFTPTMHPLNYARFNHQATLIQCGKGCVQDGDVLLTGGLDGTLSTNGNTRFAELYDPGSDSFSANGLLMATGRAFHTTYAFSDGSILVAGGISGETPSYVSLNSAELFSINPNHFSQVAGTMSETRAGLMAVDAGNSMVLLAFGGQADVEGYYHETSNGPPGTFADSDLYNPSSPSSPFTPGPSSPVTCPSLKNSGNFPMDSQGCAITRAAYAAVTLNDGRVIFIGGYDATAPVFQSAEMYTFASEKFVETTTTLSEPRVFTDSAQFESTSPPTSGILIPGGLPACDGTADAYSAGSGTFNPLAATMTPTVDATFRCYLYTATELSNGTVLLAGGLDTNNTVLNTAEIYDPAHDTFTPTNNNMTSPRWGHAAAMLSDGSVLIIGGADCFPGSSTSPCTSVPSEFLETAELFNPMTATFTPIRNPMLRDRFFATATPLTQPVASTGLTDLMVLIAGGSGDNFSELYDPPSQTFQAGASMNSIRFFQRATPLNDANGLVLLSGGTGESAFGNYAAIPTAELFVPGNSSISTGFCSTGDMKVSRAYHVAAAGTNSAGDLRVLVAGGVGENTSIGSAELYEPPTEQLPCTVGEKTTITPLAPEFARDLVTNDVAQISRTKDR